MKTKSGTDKPWGGRFTEKTAQAAETFSASVHFDMRLYRYDIAGSKAHAKMLAKIGLISGVELKQILGGLAEIESEIESNSFVFRPEFEDIHMNIEKALVKKVGPAGEKLHTARSRNDQVALDMRLYLRDEASSLLRFSQTCRKGLSAWRGSILALSCRDIPICSGPSQ